MSKISDKLDLILKYSSQLQELLPSSLKQYASDIRTKAACEHFFEKTIQAIIDASYLILQVKKMEVSEDEDSVFSVLEQHKLLPKPLAVRLTDAKKMRNILTHQYADINDEVVFNSLNDELAQDAEAFIKEVRKCL
ncbi:MAG TPA: DUF86 domain-containing protein [Candidatus Nanoarchaeia archaeon]|nr:DUF86 domain-containing protein [Candidatus Nanoarchaeia archaeon]